nr:MAG TPA: hypothetical protein [Caudoviricetes sp.]
MASSIGKLCKVRKLAQRGFLELENCALNAVKNMEN